MTGKTNISKFNQDAVTDGLPGWFAFALASPVHSVMDSGFSAVQKMAKN